MNEVLKAIHSRRSVRQYRPEQIADSDLQQILEAAVSAPSAMNEQRWRFTVVQDQALLDRMVAAIKEITLREGNEFQAARASAPDYHTFYHAPTVVLIAGEDKVRWAEFDCAAAAENIALAAESLGIGSCIIASSGILLASPSGDEYRAELRIPAGYRHICAVALGYRDGDAPVAPPRNAGVVDRVG